MEEIKIGFNLLNYKSFQMGGVESFVKNLIKGIKSLDINNLKFIFLINKYSEDRFKCLLKNEDIIVYDINPDNLFLRTIWQKLNFQNIVDKHKINVFFTPQAILPVKLNRVKTISVFHDCQYKDLPNNFSFLNKKWLDYINKVTLNNSDCVIAISEFTKRKIKKHYKYSKKIKVIYNPIEIINNMNNKDEKKTLGKYNVEKDNFYYTISSTAKHKNLLTLIKLFNKKTDSSLLITGPKRSEFKNLDNVAGDNIRLTGYINELEKNILIKNCKLFLFPSVYEGFGMPIIEAFLHRKKVVTTMETAIPEISFGKAEYINDPFDVDLWKRKIENISNFKLDLKNKDFFKKKFYLGNIAKEYIETFKNIRL